MATVINVKSIIEKRKYENSAFDSVKKFLPYYLCDEIESVVCTFLMKNGYGAESRIEEIRLRSDKRVYLTLGGRGAKHNVLLSTVLDSNAIADVLNKMCDGSLYTYGESIVKGYVPLENGIRVGVCGHASVENGKILGIYNVSSLNIRLPCKDISADPALIKAIRGAIKRGEGSLIFSPPAQGKTTLLRSLARSLAGGSEPMRVALVDTRDEIGYSLRDKALSLDVLSGYPQAEGIRIATAFMNPQVIICDEIGSEEDALAISQAQNCGVPLIATSHGAALEQLMRRRGIRELHDVGAFGLYVGIKISASGFEYKVYAREVLGGDSGNSASFI